MLVHGASADRYLETVGRSISELSRRRGSSSRPFVADALSWCSTNQPVSTRLPAPRWRVVHWTAGDGRLVPASRVAWVRAAGHAGQGCGELWRGGDARSLWRAAVLGVVSRSSAAGAGRAGSVSDSAVRLGEHSSCVPCQPPGGTRRPNRLVSPELNPWCGPGARWGHQALSRRAWIRESGAPHIVLGRPTLQAPCRDISKVRV